MTNKQQIKRTVFAIGILQVLWGTALLITGAIAGVAWLAFCFGSVIIGVLLLIFAPDILLLPFGLCVYALMHLNAGYLNIFNPRNIPD